MKHYGKLKKKRERNNNNNNNKQQQKPHTPNQTAFRASMQMVFIERLQIHIIETGSTNSDGGRVKLQSENKQE